MSNLLEGKTALILGVANKWSLAWAIAQAFRREGASLILTYQGERLKKTVEELAAELGASRVLECDVTRDEDLARLSELGRLDAVVHSIAFANREDLDRPFVETSRAGFALALEVSAYSLVAVARAAAPLMSEGGAMITLTYLGSSRVLTNYNVMGVAKAALEASVKYLAVDLGRNNIRVNAISAGPIKTLAASGIGDFRYILKWNQLNSPLRRNVTIEDVGGASVYLLSDLSAGVSGEIHHVDCGYHVVGMKAVDAPDISVV